MARALSFLVVVGCVLSAACDAPMKDTPDAGAALMCDGDACTDDRDCPQGFCDVADVGAAAGCCVAATFDCSISAECDDGCWCNERRGWCQCDWQLCDPLTNEHCPDGQLCTYEDGEPRCLTAPPPAVACAIIVHERIASDAQPGVAVADEPLPLAARVTDSAGALVAHATPTFFGDGVNGASLVASCADEDGCVVRVTASASGATCEAPVVVWPAVEPGVARAFVRDALSGAPLVGVPVTFGVGDARVTVQSDAAGRAEAPWADARVSAVSVFAPAHTWVTVMNAPRDVVLPLMPVVAASRAAGFAADVDFERVSTQGDIKLAFGGVAIAPDPFALSARAIVGERALTHLEVEGLTDEGGELVELSSGMVLALGNESIRPALLALGAPGRRAAWALGGKLRLSEVGPLWVTTLDGEPSRRGENHLRTLARVLPRFDHAIRTNLLPSVLIDRPSPQPNGAPAAPDTWPLDALTLIPDTLVSQTIAYTAPTLPCAQPDDPPDACAAPVNAPGASPFHAGLLVVTAVHVPADGLLPIGLGAAFDRAEPATEVTTEAHDGVVDHDPELPGSPARGMLHADYAPPHDGLEGLPVVVVALSFPEGFDPLAADPFPQPQRAVADRPLSGGAGARAFPAPMLPAPRATWIAEDATLSSVDARGADAVRVVLDDGAGAQWHLWLADATDVSTDVALDELAPAQVVISERAVRARMESFTFDAATRLAGGLAALVGPGGPSLAELTSVSVAWSAEPCLDGSAP